MRRILAVLAVTVLLVPGLVALASIESVSDDFSEGHYRGNDGSLDWAGSWEEIGESDGPATGKVRVADRDCSNNRCLQLAGAGLLTQVGARRGADLSTLSSATLRYYLYIEAGLVSEGTLEVQARNGGSVWTPLRSYVLALEEGQHSESVDVSALAGTNFELRFRLTGLLSEDNVSIDDVSIEGPVQVTTTSTTSTIPLTIPPTTLLPTSTTSSTTSTTIPASTTTTIDDRLGSPGGTTTSTTSTVAVRSGTGDVGETTTTIATPSTTRSDTVTGSPRTPPLDGGLRRVPVGLMAGYRPGTTGDLDVQQVEVLGVDLEADFSLAVEVFEATKVWIGLLALLITAVIIAGMDRRRNDGEGGRR